MPENFQFASQGATISAHIYKPDVIEGELPAVVLCHGFCGVKELLLPAFAEAFAKAGFVALTFDYRGFGESEGEVGRLVPRLQIEDIHAAVAALASSDFVDAARIGLWGSSYGGANAIVAATETADIKAVCVQVTFGDGERVVTGDLSDDEKTKLFASLEKMQARKDSGKEMWLPLSKVLSDEQSQAFYQRYCEAHPALKTKIPFLTTQETIGHKPEAYLADLNAPLHITVATNDGVNPPAESYSLFEKANEPKALLEVEATHYDVYEGEAFEQTVSSQIEWFMRYL